MWNIKAGHQNKIQDKFCLFGSLGILNTSSWIRMGNMIKCSLKMTSAALVKMLKFLENSKKKNTAEQIPIKYYLPQPIQRKTIFMENLPSIEKSTLWNKWEELSCFCRRVKNIGNEFLIWRELGYIKSCRAVPILY